MPVFCVVYGRSNQSNGENTRRFYHVRTCVHKGGKVKKLTEMQEKVACKPVSAVGRSRSDNTRANGYDKI